jgi:hypothetical protein
MSTLPLASPSLIRYSGRAQNGWRITSARRRLTSSSNKNPKDIPPPLPPQPPSASSASAASKTQKVLSPVEAKRRYLESKARTEEFLKDPQRKINQLQSEMDQVREKLEKEVYNKSIWRRLTDPLKRKQHSLINMIAASFAYILAYQLHLKRQLNAKLQSQIDEEQEKVTNIKQLLQSILDDDFLQDISNEISYELNQETQHQQQSNHWPWRNSAKNSASAVVDDSVIVSILRQKLEDRIGDEGLDDEAKKQRNIDRIWKENQKRLQQSTSLEDLVVTGDNVDDTSVEELLALASQDNNSNEQPSSGSGGASVKRKHVFDM